MIWVASEGGRNISSNIAEILERANIPIPNFARNPKFDVWFIGTCTVGLIVSVALLVASLVIGFSKRNDAEIDIAIRQYGAATYVDPNSGKFVIAYANIHLRNHGFASKAIDFEFYVRIGDELLTGSWLNPTEPLILDESITITPDRMLLESSNIFDGTETRYLEEGDSQVGFVGKILEFGLARTKIKQGLNSGERVSYFFKLRDSQRRIKEYNFELTEDEAMKFFSL